MEDYFYSYLQVAKLEKYYPNFVKSGITHSSSLTNLKTIDYYNLGIKENRDQKKLFQLIDIIRNLDPSEEVSSQEDARKSEDKMSSPALQQKPVIRVSSGSSNSPSSLASPAEMYRKLTGRDQTKSPSPRIEIQRSALIFRKTILQSF